MKRILLFLIILRLAVTSNRLFAQTFSDTCDLEDFSTYNGHTIQYGCTFDIYQEGSDRTVKNWYMYDGKNPITYMGLSPQDYYVELTADDINHGSSIFANYANGILSNTDYYITVRARTAQEIGQADIHGVNGFTEKSPYDANCDPLIYNPGQEIATFNLSNTDFQTFTQEYHFSNATQSGINEYSQIYVSPKWLSGSNYFILDFNSIEICPCCDSTTAYTNGQMPYGPTYYGYINVGNQGTGGATVTISPTNATTLNAFHQVTINPETIIAPSSNGSFVAEIVDCPSGSQSFARKAVASSVTKEKTNTLFNKNNIIIYPNPVHSILNLQLSNRDEGWQSIKIINSLGNVMRLIDNKSNIITKSLNVDMNKFAAGIYFIQVETKSKVFTQKIIKD